MDLSPRKTQIMETAGSMFSRQGYHATTMRDIARELNMQGGSLYAHIASKEDMLWAIVERAADEFQAAVAPLADLPLPAGERLQRMLTAHVGVVTRNLDNATVFFHEWRFLGPARRSIIAAQRDAYEGLFRRVIQAGIDAGEFPGADARMGSLLVLSAGNWLYQWFRPDGALPADTIAAQMAAMIIAGLQCVKRKT